MMYADQDLQYRYLSIAAALAVACLIAYSVFLTQKRGHKHGLREPPYLHPYIPFIGHLIGLIRKGARYFEDVKYDHASTPHVSQHQLSTHPNSVKKLPIFTLPILTGRNYVITDAHLAGIVQRNGKTMSFYSLIVEVTRRLIAFDQDATRITFYNMNGEHGPGGLMSRVHEMVNRHLAPGPLLEASTKIQVQMMSKFLNEPMSDDGIIVNLYHWQRHILGMSNMTAIYGPENIFAVDERLERAFWDFEEGMLGLVVDILPQFTTRKAFQARQKVFSGLIDYVKNKSYRKASGLINERVETNLEYGMSEEMAGHSELILMFGILGNAVPSNFWLLANLFSRPALVKDIREEIALALSGYGSSEEQQTCSRVSVSARTINMRTCPLLYSCYRETLREISLLTSARLVLENTVLADTYILKKGSVVQIAGGVLGRDEAVWGDDAKEFKPDRFISGEGRQRSEGTDKGIALPMPNGVPSASFRAFGGGTVICPGRHFAQTELMLFAAAVVLAFDITEVEGETLRLPGKDETRIPLSVMKPVYEPIVRIKRRKGWEETVLDMSV